MAPCRRSRILLHSAVPEEAADMIPTVIGNVTHGSAPHGFNNKNVSSRSRTLLPHMLAIFVVSAISTHHSMRMVRRASILKLDHHNFYAQASVRPLAVAVAASQRQEEDHDNTDPVAMLRRGVLIGDKRTLAADDLTMKNRTIATKSDELPYEVQTKLREPAQVEPSPIADEPVSDTEQQNITVPTTEVKPEPEEEHKQQQPPPTTRGDPVVAADASTHHEKPRFVLHVGPMKTGTSSLQADLDWLLGDQLEQDGWMYIKDKSPFNDIPTEDPEVFLQQFKVEADKLLQLNKNVIRSREQYSDLFSERPWMYERLKEILSGWDVEVIAGYRTYDTWLVSFHYQAYRMPFSGQQNLEERRKNSWRRDNGDLFRIEPLFPNFFNFWKHRKRFTDAIVETAGPVFPVKIFDVTAPKGARSTFLCDVLGQGAAPVTCAESLRMDRENPPLKVNKSNTKEIQYDAIALGAVGQGMVDEHRFRRSDIVDAIVTQQEEELQRTVNDFPFICPDDALYQEFWNITSAKDALCMPEKYQTDLDYETKFHTKFLKAVENKKFCRVDVDAVLADGAWQQFFAQFAPLQQQVETQ